MGRLERKTPKDGSAFIEKRRSRNGLSYSLVTYAKGGKKVQLDCIDKGEAEDLLFFHGLNMVNVK